MGLVQEGIPFPLNIAVFMLQVALLPVACVVIAVSLYQEWKDEKTRPEREKQEREKERRKRQRQYDELNRMMAEIRASFDKADTAFYEEYDALLLEVYALTDENPPSASRRKGLIRRARQLQSRIDGCYEKCHEKEELAFIVHTLSHKQHLHQLMHHFHFER